MALSPQAQAVRLRLYEDFEYYAKHCLKIRTKDQRIAPLVLNRAQRRLLDLISTQLTDTGRVRIIILKGRQMGLSTMVGGFLYWWVSQRKAQKCLVVAHKSDATRTLFDMTRRYHDRMPEAIRTHTRYSSRKELAFTNLDSSYTVVTAGGDGIARSETITAAHLSELAFWPPNIAAENYSGLMDTVPKEDGTVVVIESTANGVSGIFYDQWKAAMLPDGHPDKSEFAPIFLPWFIDDGYRMAVPASFERTPYEEELVRTYDLDNEQLMFRRVKVAEKGLDLFKQEYPCNATEAFLTSGRPVFVPEQIAELLKNAPTPIARLGLEAGEWLPHSHGELLCYAPHDPAETYYIGADVGGGVQRDWSVAQVLDSAGRQVATYRAQIDPDPYANVLEALGKFYNTARIIVELNNHGILTCTRLGKDFAYPNFFTEVGFDKITETETLKLGFTTTSKSKPLIIDKLRAGMRDGSVKVSDKQTLEEMRSYIVTETNKMEAEHGCFDDCVMALALAWHVNEGVYEPIVNQDSWYVTMPG